MGGGGGRGGKGAERQRKDVLDWLLLLLFLFFLIPFIFSMSFIIVCVDAGINVLFECSSFLCFLLSLFLSSSFSLLR